MSGERRIEASLKTPVLLKYDKRPLRDVMDDLARLADINIHLDQQGMAIEGITYETPVTINLSQEISLKSALLLILEPMRMNYVITNDVLKVTSGELTNTKVYTKSYPVADLIIPIPNFVPDGREGINAALEHGYRRCRLWRRLRGFGADGRERHGRRRRPRRFGGKSRRQRAMASPAPTLRRRPACHSKSALPAPED